MGLHGLNSEENKRLGSATNTNINGYMQACVEEPAAGRAVAGTAARSAAGAFPSVLEKLFL